MTNLKHIVSLLLALLLFAATSVNATESITYIHTDHLGSPIAATNEDGSVKWTEDYQPFGVQRTNQDSDNTTGFTGHQHDDSLELTYMQARWYHPEVGRFMALDPLLYRDLHSFNRYVYANNNPYKFVDHNGMCASIADEANQRACQVSRAEAVNMAKEEVGKANVSIGQKESAFIATYNTKTKSVKTRKGNAAANRANGGVVFINNEGNPIETTEGSDGLISGTSDIVLVTGHSHPQEYGPPHDRFTPDSQSLEINTLNENISANENDKALSRMAPLVLKTPSGKVKVFRNEKEVK